LVEHPTYTAVGYGTLYFYLLAARKLRINLTYHGTI